MEDKILKFLTERKHLFRLTGIEEATGIPYTTLTKAMADLPSRHLTDDQQAKLVTFFKNLKKILEKNFGD